MSAIVIPDCNFWSLYLSWSTRRFPTSSVQACAGHLYMGYGQFFFSIESEIKSLACTLHGSSYGKRLLCLSPQKPPCSDLLVSSIDNFLIVW